MVEAMARYLADDQPRRRTKRRKRYDSSGLEDAGPRLG